MPREKPQEQGTQAWHFTWTRPLDKRDAGQLVVAYDRYAALLVGELVADEFGVSIRSSDGVDVHTSPAHVVERHYLLNKPEMTPKNYLEPVWDYRGDLGDWTHYVSGTGNGLAEHG